MLRMKTDGTGRDRTGRDRTGWDGMGLVGMGLLNGFSTLISGIMLIGGTSLKGMRYIKVDWVGMLCNMRRSRV